MAIDSSVGGVAANSYASEAEATAYLAGRLGTEPYDNATADNQEKALRTAALWLDSRVDWIGDVKDQVTPQALAWPRVYDASVDSPQDVLVLGEAIPRDLKNAQIELALYLLANGEPQESNDLDEIRVGSLTIDFHERKASKMIPDRVWAMVSYMGQRKSSSESMRVVALER